MHRDSGSFLVFSADESQTKGGQVKHRYRLDRSFGFASVGGGLCCKVKVGLTGVLDKFGARWWSRVTWCSIEWPGKFELAQPYDACSTFPCCSCL